MNYAKYETIEDKFKRLFQYEYDGRQDSAIGKHDFVILTNYHISWTQVHGDFKDAMKRDTFVPYPHGHNYMSAVAAPCASISKWTKLANITTLRARKSWARRCKYFGKDIT